MESAKTIDLIKNTVGKNTYSGRYLIEEISTGRKKVYYAEHQASAIAKAIDNPELGYIVSYVEETAESNRIAFLKQEGLTDEEIKADPTLVGWAKMAEYENKAR